MTEVAYNATGQATGQYAYNGVPALPTPQPVDNEGDGDASGAEHAVTSVAPAGRVAVQVVDRMRNTAERGSTTVPSQVIEKIAVLAVREVPGVYAFAGATAAEADRPLAIHLDGRTATVEIRLVVEYGFAVYAVTDKVRTKVISALENLFALDVGAVDIVIEDIHIDEPDPAAEE